VILSTLLILCCSTLPADSAPIVPAASAIEIKASAGVPKADVDVKPGKPDAPTPKIAPSNEDAPLALESAAGPIQPGVNGPTRPATTDSWESPRQRKIWYGLMAAGHGAAAFDAWTTRRAVTSGYGVEGDPMQRPFAHSGAIYATTQISPLIMDYVGYRMMRSKNPMIRKFWWVPQAANASVSLGAAIHNYRVVP
jgi:hypothetical protein